MFQLYGPIVVVVIILALRMRSLSKERSLNPRRLWIVPLVLVVLAGWILFMNPPGPGGLLICLAALAVGGALGWQRGKLIRMWRDPASGDIRQKASPVAMLLLVGVLLVRFVIRQYFDANPSSDGQFHGDALIVTDALLTFAVGLVAATRLELMVRARQLAAGEEGRPA